MSDDDCIHGMKPAWCATCSGRDGAPARPTEGQPLHGSRSKQNLVNDLCDLLGVARHSMGPGSVFPSRVFAAAATRAKVRVRGGSMPKVGAAIAAKAGLPWGPECHSSSSQSGTPSVTRDGLDVVVKAMGILAKR